MAALGVPALLWLGARRDGPPALNALAYPALGLLVVAMLLAYSRGALLALAVGLRVLVRGRAAAPARRGGARRRRARRGARGRWAFGQRA